MSKEACKLFLKSAIFQEFHSYIKNANHSIENLTNNGELETCDGQLLLIPHQPRLRTYLTVLKVIHNTVTVKKKLNSDFVRWNKTQLKSSSSSVVDVGKKSTWRVAFLSLKPQLEDLQDVISLLFHSLSMSNISKITIKFSGLSVWITSVSLSGQYCWMNYTVRRKKDRRLERAKSKNWSGSAWRKNPVQRLLSDSRPLYSSGATFHD